MTNSPPSPYAVRVADLVQTRPTAFDITLNAKELTELRDDLRLNDLRKTRFYGEISPLGDRDWQLNGQLGATVEQPCVATLAPVRSRVDREVVRKFMSDFVETDDPEAEMPEDDETEALGRFIDPWSVLREALSLALPLYPRAKDSDLVNLSVTEPGQTPMTDDDAKPFAGLAALRDKLDQGSTD